MEIGTKIKICPNTDLSKEQPLWRYKAEMGILPKIKISFPLLIYRAALSKALFSLTQKLLWCLYKCIYMGIFINISL